MAMEERGLVSQSASHAAAEVILGNERESLAVTRTLNCGSIASESV